MAVLSKSDGLRRDIPLGPSENFASAAAGSAADYEHPIWALPDLTKLASSGQVGDLPINSMQVREVVLIPEAGITGAATNNFTWNVRQLRGGLPLVSTTTATAVASAGVATITPASMTNIQVGMVLLVDVGASQERVTVTAIASTTFTATFAFTHSGTWNIVAAPLATVSYTAGTNETTLVPHVLVALAGNAILPNDVITLQRVSSNATGLASPAVTVALDCVPVAGKLARG